MSKAATATPPPPAFFPQRNVTPTQKHLSGGRAASSVGFRDRTFQTGRKRSKINSSPTCLDNKRNATAPVTKGVSNLSLVDDTRKQSEENPFSFTHSALSVVSAASYRTVKSEESQDTDITEDVDRETETDTDQGRITPTPSFVTIGSSVTDSSVLTDTLITPTSSRAPSLVQTESSLSFSITKEPSVTKHRKSLHSDDVDSEFSDLFDFTPISQDQALAMPQPKSWVGNFGKMAKAMVNTGMQMGMSFSDKRKKDVTGANLTSPKSSSPVKVPESLPKSAPIQAPVQLPVAPVVDLDWGPVTDNFSLLCRSPKPMREECKDLSDAEFKDMVQSWRERDQARVAPFVRLCSQYPLSGYNLAKWGPYGARTEWLPASFANPAQIHGQMCRQAELERRLVNTQSTFFPCHGSSGSDSDSSPRSESASQNSSSVSPPSPATSTWYSSISSSAHGLNQSFHDISCVASVKAQENGRDEQKTAEDIKLAMTSLLVPTKRVGSITELGNLTRSMALNGKDDDPMGAIDIEEPLDLASSALLELSASVPTKRSLITLETSAEVEEKEKRRRVDEAAVLREAVNTGVIVPAFSVPNSIAASAEPHVSKDSIGQSRQLSASVPNLSAETQKASEPSFIPTVYGHVVKTSTTHPIIISEFFPTELLFVLSQNLVIPESGSSFMMGSKIDVPSLLLSYTSSHPPTPAVEKRGGNGHRSQSQPAPSRSASVLPSPVKTSFNSPSTGFNEWIRFGDKPLGNILLSSCPGKRLRMDGPVRGRSPVWRDLGTDLRRIKGEGVGCLVCCLDDEELALLGVPWETYRTVAEETGLEVIRLPMLDGLTPVSLSLFDCQINLIVTRYSLMGVNVLVHCRAGVGRAGVTACAWAIKMGFVSPHPSLAVVEEASLRQQKSVTPLTPSSPPPPLENQIVMSIVERGIAMLRARRGLKAIESCEQVQFLVAYVRWLRVKQRESDWT